MPRRCACCFIIPPYLLSKLLESSDEKIRARAQSTLSAMARTHSARMALSTNLSVAPRRTGAQQKRRRVFDCENTTDLSRRQILNEGDPASGDVAAQEAYDHAGVTWDFFQKVFGRDSVDDRGATLISSVHYSENGDGFDNAFWNGSQMVYGDGAEIFGRMTQSLDVVAHELTHGVTQHAAGLPYEKQSGALNEHFSDVFGVLTKQWRLNQTDPQLANWLIGDGLLLTGGALRSMSDPGSANSDDPQPGHMDRYADLPNDARNDWGGVHTNSGIPNRAFHLAAVALRRPSWEIAGKVWYLTLTTRLKGETDFLKCANETVSVARDYFDKATAAAISKAWTDVGVAPTVKSV